MKTTLRVYHTGEAGVNQISMKFHYTFHMIIDYTYQAVLGVEVRSVSFGSLNAGLFESFLLWIFSLMDAYGVFLKKQINNQQEILP